jgi:hypothetical protein
MRPCGSCTAINNAEEPFVSVAYPEDADRRLLVSFHQLPIAGLAVDIRPHLQLIMQASLCFNTSL